MDSTEVPRVRGSMHRSFVPVSSMSPRFPLGHSPRAGEERRETERERKTGEHWVRLSTPSALY